ncbi:MFS transporter [Kineosporia succinea]|uniref:CP family cyanate transporter-like MFS transporter n=1 Tax=Kineosporia succinea TaxID=84632 RepID=A0ABT9P572_9ACTN|nr:MFS transporter [Kineosporia succinea]MDP9827627.1 CP family cyanate transporter-like MFS transporter [Kineosporia succinea]
MTTTAPDRAASSRARSAALPLLLLSGLVLVWLVMRGPIIAVAPTIADIQNSLGIDSATAGLLTTIPVICFGLATPLALMVTRRAGLNNAVHVSLLFIFAGVVVRSLGGLPVVLLGTLMLGFGITIANIVVPVIIGRDFPGRTTQVTGYYTASINVGALAATTSGAPLADWLGWRPALALWAVLVVVAALVWRMATPYTQPEVALPAAARGPSVWRRKLVIGMVLCFAGQSFSYYGVTAWLPTLLADERGLTAAQAGGSSAFFQALALVAAFGVPFLIHHGMPARTALLLVCSCWISLPLGLAFAPSLWVLWSCLGGFAQGGGFTVIFSVVVSRAANHDEAKRMSAAVQGVGYILGALGPMIVGAVHSATGTWNVPMLVIAGMIVVMAVGGSVAIGRPAGAVHAADR